jgi:hypothetical protein
MTPEYLAAYKTALAADERYSAACREAYGTPDRWRNHTDPAVLSAQQAKYDADRAMHTALAKMRGAQ